MTLSYSNVGQGGGKKRGSSRRKRMSGGLPIPTGGGGADTGAGATGSGSLPNSFGDITKMASRIMSQGGGSFGLPTVNAQTGGPSMGGMGIQPAISHGGAYTRRMRKRSGRARHHRTKSYSAGGKKGRKTRRRHRRRH